MGRDDIGKISLRISGFLKILNLLNNLFFVTKEIIRIEADRSYSWFFLSDGRKILVSRNLKEYQELLNDRSFFRTHNSHLVNLEYVKKFVRQDGGYIEMTDGSTVSISRGKKELFLIHMSKFSH